MVSKYYKKAMPKGIKGFQKGHGKLRKDYKKSDITRKKLSVALLGRKLTAEHIEKRTISQRGLKRTEATKKRMSDCQQEEEKSHAWKGDNVGYSALHKWVYRKLGRPCMCEHCGITVEERKRIQWANRSGEYLRDVSDWIRLCVPCHKAYDSKKQ